MMIDPLSGAETPPFVSPALPDNSQPAAPGEGPEGLPTPALPDLQQPAAPGEGPLGLPTPSLPSRPQVALPVRRCPTGYTAAEVRHGQRFTDLLLEHNVSYEALRSANPTLSTSMPQAGTRYCVPPALSRRLCPSGSQSYVMGPGDTLRGLARLLDMDPGALLITNPNLAPGDFIPGRVVCLPVS